MDERQFNNVKALVAAGITLGFLLGLAHLFLIPIHEHQKQQMIQEHCPDGLDNCGLIIEPSPLWMLLGMPSVVVYFVTYNYLENKRMKTWRSYT